MMNKFTRNLLVAASLVFLFFSVAFASTYQATVGSGTYFGGLNAGGSSGAAIEPWVVPCDATTSGQCAAVDSSGNISVKTTVALPAGTNTIGAAYGSTSNNVNALQHVCSKHAFVSNITTATDTQIVAISGSTNIYICDYSFSAAAADNIYLESATAGSCGGSKTKLDQIWYLATNESKGSVKSLYTGLNTGASNALCVNTSTTGPFDIAVDYDQY
jgi:hypothetical protein